MASIYLRNGIWYIKFKHAGRWSYKSLGTKAKRQALLLKAQIETELKKPPPGPEVALTIARLAEIFLPWVKENRRPQTLESRVRAFERWDRLMGDMKISEVTPDHVELFRTSVRRDVLRGDGSRTVNVSIDSLRAGVNRAQRMKWYVGANPFADVEPIPEAKRRPKWLDADDLANVLDFAELAGRNAELFFRLCIFAGLRKGEALNARWEWIDFAAGLVHVTENENWTIKDHEERTIPLHDKLRETLEKYREPSGWIVAPSHEYGADRYRYNIRKQFDRVKKGTGLEWITPHVLRHTFASQLASAGVDLYKIAVWLGHADTRTTVIYAHLRPADPDINRF